MVDTLEYTIYYNILSITVYIFILNYTRLYYIIILPMCIIVRG